MTSEEKGVTDLSNLGDASGERISVTDAGGTIARFEMSYSPPTGGERVVFGPPLRMRVPSYVYLGFTTLVMAVVAAGYNASSNSQLYVWVVEGDRGRPFAAWFLGLIVLVSGIGTVIRAHMRGVILDADGVQARYLLPMGIPRVRRWVWPQVHRLIADDTQVMLELWDGTYERLPDVADTAKLASMLATLADKRGIMTTRLEDIAKPRG